MKLASIFGSILLSFGASVQGCNQDVKVCPDGQTLNRNPTDNCNFPLCQGESDCSSASTGNQDNVLMCSNTLRYRDGFNNCNFEQCGDPRCALEDYKQCPSPYLHVYVARDPKAGASGCQDWLPCPGSGTPDNGPPEYVMATTKNLRTNVIS
eukprot:CAMPEP_0172478704 /NCGR_PEP_ID=MMETSP1066-20121228/2827_1 /TAXON_ID=671091 /ORGANISM="Coscinodiscus wailesii, Strain CCMP2513" /LENGTH=151 /DNA_ID=CAMNT_0013238509 /DNA_START=56 /DNA_END=511 /DNA_ORIENTATION=-